MSRSVLYCAAVLYAVGVVLCWCWPVISCVRVERGERSEPRDALEMKKEKTKRGKRGKRLTLAFSDSCLVSIPYFLSCFASLCVFLPML